RVVLYSDRRAEVVADVDQYGRVHVLEIARAHEEWAAHELLLRRAEGENHRPGQVVALHRALDRVGRADRDASVSVVAFHMARRPLNERLPRDVARRLRAFGQRVDLGNDGDNGLPFAPFRPHVGRHAGAAELDAEPDALQRLLQEFRALDFLHAELTVVI